MHMGSFSEGTVRIAQARAQKMGILKNSFCNGNGSCVGFIGEAMVLQLLWRNDIPASLADTFNYDICAGTAAVKLEVKTMTAKVAPKQTTRLLNLVSAHNACQQADFYVFVRVVWRNSSDFLQGGDAYLCNALPCTQLKQVATYKTKAHHNFRSDCWAVEVNKCLTWQDLCAALTSRQVLSKSKLDK